MQLHTELTRLVHHTGSSGSEVGNALVLALSARDRDEAQGREAEPAQQDDMAAPAGSGADNEDHMRGGFEPPSAEVTVACCAACAYAFLCALAAPRGELKSRAVIMLLHITQPDQ